MKRKLISLLLLATLLFSNLSIGQVKAQDSEKAPGSEKALFKNWAVGVDILTLYGYGIYGATSITPNLKARVGFDYLNFTYDDAIDFDADAIDANGQDLDRTMSGEFTKANLKFPNAKVLIDYYPRENGIFSVTAGFYVGQNKISANGKIKDYHAGDQFEIIDDVVIKPRTDGTFEAQLKMGNTIKPYFGIGLGRTIATNNRVGFKFDLGVVYQGKMEIQSDQIQNTKALESAADLPFSESLLSWYPMIGFSLSYRIK